MQKKKAKIAADRQKFAADAQSFSKLVSTLEGITESLKDESQGPTPEQAVCNLEHEIFEILSVDLAGNNEVKTILSAQYVSRSSSIYRLNYRNVLDSLRTAIPPLILREFETKWSFLRQSAIFRAKVEEGNVLSLTEDAIQ
jgi:hypothetical protein